MQHRHVAIAILLLAAPTASAPLLLEVAPAGPGPVEAADPRGSDAGGETIPRERVFVHNNSGALRSRPLPPGFPEEFEFRVTHTGYMGPEPSAGVDSSGQIFFQAWKNTLKSIDQGHTWQDVTPPDAPLPTNDPILWLDPATDRVHVDHLRSTLSTFTPLILGCTYLFWTDNQGDDWQANPRFCPTAPLDEPPSFEDPTGPILDSALSTDDHQKVTTGILPPGFTVHGIAIPSADALPKPVFLAWRHFNLGRSYAAMSLDGGLTLPFVTKTFEQAGCQGHHGRIRSLPTGTLLIPRIGCQVPPNTQPAVLRSTDFWDWESIDVRLDAGRSDDRGDPEVGVDIAGNAYFVWTSPTQRGVVSASLDDGLTWGPATAFTPPQVGSSTMHAVVAGEPGRVAMAYYGTRDSSLGPGSVPPDARWHAYMSFSLDALHPDPTWVTVQLDTDEDPIQVGTIQTLTGPPPQDDRNLKEFIDIVRTPGGRVVAAYADGCTLRNDCAFHPDPTPEMSRDDEGVAAILLRGPLLIE